MLIKRLYVLRITIAPLILSAILILLLNNRGKYLQPSVWPEAVSLLRIVDDMPPPASHPIKVFEGQGLLLTEFLTQRNENLSRLSIENVLQSVIHAPPTIASGETRYFTW
jgi:hypothetical protein